MSLKRSDDQALRAALGPLLGNIDIAETDLRAAGDGRCEFAECGGCGGYGGRSGSGRTPSVIWGRGDIRMRVRESYSGATKARTDHLR